MIGTSERYTSDQILHLWGERGVAFSPEAMGSLGDLPDVSLIVCSECGFGAFNPRCSAASGAFYADMQLEPTYYTADKWEFAQVLPAAGTGVSVLDIGCGSGLFLEMVVAQGAVGRGIELNQDAVAHARAKGLDVRAIDVATANSVWPGGYDLVCLFQVLEHVEDPLEFARQAWGLVRPGGALIVSVPDAEGSLRWVQPVASNVPPHHLTRWTSRSLVALGGALGMSVEWVRHEPLASVHFEHLAWWWRRAVLRIAPYDTPGPLRHFADRIGGVAIRQLAHLLRVSGVRHLPLHGHTVMAHLRRRR